MTDTPTDDEAPEQPGDAPAPETSAPGTESGTAPGTGPDVPADQPIAISATIGTGEHEPVKDRLLLPLLVPVLSAIAVGVLAVNISRVFLAGNSESALFVAIVVTLAILGGASLLAAAPHMRTSSLAMVVGLVIVIIMGGGLITLGPSLGHEGEAAACEAPAGPAVGQLDVEAINAPLSFNAKNYDVPAGVVDVKYFGASGHTLAFREPDVLCVELAIPGPPTEEKVDLKAGQTYEIYCTIPGHAAAGMDATVTVAGA